MNPARSLGPAIVSGDLSHLWIYLVGTVLGALLGAWEASGYYGSIAADYVPPPGGTNGFWIGGLWVSGRSGKRDWELTEAEEAAEDEPWLTLTLPVRDLLLRLAA